jgi:hypothetical protein
MFVVHCPGHRSDVLLDASRIRGMRTAAEGPVLDWECWCGERGHLVNGVSTAATPRPATGPPPVPAHAA